MSNVLNSRFLPCIGIAAGLSMSNQILDIPAERATQSLVPISLDTLITANVLAFDLYLPPTNGQRFRLYGERSQPFTQDDIDRLRHTGTRTLFIAADDSRAYHHYLREHVLASPDLAPTRRFQILRQATRTVLSDALCRRDVGNTLRITRDVGLQLVQTVCSAQLKLHELLRLLAHDYSVFTHALNVATCSLLLWHRFGISQEHELLQIGQGALLHDIGQQHIPRTITHKPGQLNQRERKIVMRHPILGFRELAVRPDISRGQLMMVYQHHERCDGRGYPVR